jgi:hypothetical protein
MDARDTAERAMSTACGSGDGGTESEFERLCREQAQRRFQRTRHAYR